MRLETMYERTNDSKNNAGGEKKGREDRMRFRSPRTFVTRGSGFFNIYKSSNSLY